MQKLLHFMAERNKYLEKYYSINESEISRFHSGDFEGIDLFYANREAILEIIDVIESHINQNIESIETEPAQMIKNEINNMLQFKDEIIKRILKQDLDLISCIDKEKTKLIIEMQDTKKNKKAISSYKGGVKKSKFDKEL